MAEEHDLQLQSAISAINDLVSRIDSLHDLSEIGSIILRLDFINRMLVNLEVPDDVAALKAGIRNPESETAIQRDKYFNGETHDLR